MSAKSVPNGGHIGSDDDEDEVEEDENGWKVTYVVDA